MYGKLLNGRLDYKSSKVCLHLITQVLCLFITILNFRMLVVKLLYQKMSLFAVLHVLGGGTDTSGSMVSGWGTCLVVHPTRFLLLHLVDVAC